MKNTKTVVNESTARFLHYARKIMPNASKQEIAQLAEQMCVETYKQIKQFTPRP